jgi:hypothetical protein
LLKERLQFGFGSVSGPVRHCRSFRPWFHSRALEQRRPIRHPERAATSEEELYACPSGSRYKRPAKKENGWTGNGGDNCDQSVTRNPDGRVPTLGMTAPDAVCGRKAAI